MTTFIPSFLLKIIRNGLILGTLYFVSIWTVTDDMNYIIIKPALVFLAGYILVELAHHYGLETQLPPTDPKPKMLIL